jgi:PBP1b-binding outer membrane lipoprotein LpoB
MIAFLSRFLTPLCYGIDTPISICIFISGGGPVENKMASTSGPREGELLWNRLLGRCPALLSVGLAAMLLLAGCMTGATLTETPSANETATEAPTETATATETTTPMPKPEVNDSMWDKYQRFAAGYEGDIEDDYAEYDRADKFEEIKAKRVEGGELHVTMLTNPANGTTLGNDTSFALKAYANLVEALYETDRAESEVPANRSKWIPDKFNLTLIDENTGEVYTTGTTNKTQALWREGHDESYPGNVYNGLKHTFDYLDAAKEGPAFDRYS